MSEEKFLIVSATNIEIKPLLNSSNKISDNNFEAILNGHKADIIITGVGINAMTYAITKAIIKNNYKFIILVGIAGSFNSQHKIGSVVNVMSEEFSDLGVKTNNGFVDIFDMKLCNANEFPYSNKKLDNYTLINNHIINNLPPVSGSTVQTIISSSKSSIATKTDVESMEGAAFFYCCMMEKQAFIQIRSISNFVGETDKAKWNIPLAVSSLNIIIRELFNEISS